IKAYKPESSSMNSGQVLKCPYDFEKAKLVVWEMADMLALDLVDKGLVTDQIVLTVGYDVENLQDFKRAKAYKGEITTDHYGRKVPKHGHGTKNLGRMTSSSRIITKAVQELYEDIVNPALLIRRLYLSVNHLTEERLAKDPNTFEQLELFTDYGALEESRAKEREELSKERRLQEAMLTVKKKYGKNAMLKGTNLTEGATAKERNGQIGGHRA
ncbi:MAG: DNA methylase, partial [Alistipes sp.]|nr:DNA methylase [Alistipes sp.]